MIKDKLTHISSDVLAENVAEACAITRQEQDEFALQSQLKCEAAVSLERFDTEIESIILSSTNRMLILIRNKNRKFSFILIFFCRSR